MNQRKTILLVDDEPGLRNLLRVSIGTERFDLLEAPDGATALALAQVRRPELIILDVGLPESNGYDVCRSLRANPATCHARVIMLTAWANEVERQAGLAAGADAYITKPFRPVELISLIDRLLDAGPADAFAAAATSARGRLPHLVRD